MQKQFIARRMEKLSAESPFAALAKAKELERKGKSIIHLEIGEPDFDTPANIKRKAIETMEAGQTHYSPSQGIRELRECIARYVSRTRGIQVKPEQVVVAPGGKPIIFFSIMACVDEGDEVLYPNPGYSSYEASIRFCGGVPVPVRLREERDFRLDIEELKSRITPRTKMIILNSPANPTGGILTREDLKFIAEIALTENLLVFSDEIYSRIIYDEEHFSIASLPGMQEQTVILDGFSKTYAMTGWRLGYGVMQEEIASRVTVLLLNSSSCVTTFVQWAGIEAIEGPQDAVDEMVAEFRRRREIMVNGLCSLPGFSCRKPAGAFYAFPNICGTGMSSRELTSYLLEEAGVAVISGGTFGEFGEGYLRFSYANSVENINLALERIREALLRLK